MFALISSFLSFGSRTINYQASVFFNISVHAPFEMLNRVLFSLFICGSLQDASNGLVFALPQIPPAWKFIIEVPYSHALGMQLEENIGHILPVLAILSSSSLERVTDENYPLHIGNEEKFLAKFLRAFEETTIDRFSERKADGKEEPVTFPDITDADECRRIIDDCISKYAPNLPKNKIFKLTFIEFLYRRVRFFDGFFYRYNQKIKQLGSIAMKQMIKEVKSLIQIDFSNDDYSRVYLVYDFCFALRLLHRDWNEVSPELKILFDNRDPVQYSSGANKNYYAECLAWLVGIRYEKFMEVVKETKFILTENFVYKLFHIHERKLTRLALIIEGETGVGKTFLLNFYSLLLNAQMNRDAAARKMVPHVIENSNQFVLGAIRTQIETDSNLRKLFSQRIDADIANSETYYNEYFSPNSSKPKPTVTNERQALLEAEGDVSGILTNIKTKLGKDEYNSYALYQIWRAILIVANQNPSPTTAPLIQMMHLFVSNEMVNYPLLDASQHLIALIQNTDSPSADVSLEIFREYLFHSRRKPLFYRLLIHPGITEEQLINFMDPIMQLARDLPEAELVVFFDEVNTSSCLGFFKEMFMDGTLRGGTIPKNIFFTAAINPKVDSDADPTMQIHRTDYIVHKLPQSLEDLKVKYGSFQSRTLANYIFQKLEVFQMAAGDPSKKAFSFDSTFQHKLADAIFQAQEFCELKLGK